MNIKILDLIRDVEFSNNNSLLLHKNDGENGLTYFGIYESAHPSWYGWNIIKRYLANVPDLKECSRVLANVSDLNKQVEQFYKKEFFDKMKLELVVSESKQIEIMCFAINVGINRCTKKIQELLNVKVDGIIGNETINALNAFNDDLFDKLFDEKEIEFYNSLDEGRYGKFKSGWRNRALKY